MDSPAVIESRLETDSIGEPACFERAFRNSLEFQFEARSQGMNSPADTRSRLEADSIGEPARFERAFRNSLEFQF
jgi:hypothetical protein